MMKNCQMCRKKSQTRICGLLRDQIKYSEHVCGPWLWLLYLFMLFAVIRVDFIIVVGGGFLSVAQTILLEFSQKVSCLVIFNY
jgi:hypothetical protein